VKDDIVRLICTHCKKSLPSLANCEVCQSPILDFEMDKGGKLHVCSRIGCTKHYVSFDDIYTTLTSFYNEYDYGAKDIDF
jgi:ssDNA-binding Zn-finger/Zn-ribbon topoisomerase 1